VELLAKCATGGWHILRLPKGALHREGEAPAEPHFGAHGSATLANSVGLPSS